MKAEEIKSEVRKRYGNVATQNLSCCAPGSGTYSEKLGYNKEELMHVPEGADLGLGCGNPVALATLKEGEVVLDLGSGAGLDVFIAAKAVGESGKVIGVDMTPEMIKKANEIVKKGNINNVEFRLGEIEDLPVEDNAVDVIISNCVINLSPDKARVFEEAYRVLRPGGRLMVSDIVLTKPLPESVQQSIAAWTGCIAGASLKEEYLEEIRKTGFSNVEILSSKNAGEVLLGDTTCCGTTRDIAQAVESISVSATK